MRILNKYLLNELKNIRLVFGIKELSICVIIVLTFLVITVTAFGLRNAIACHFDLGGW